MLIKKLDATSGETYLTSLVAFQQNLALESEGLKLDEKILLNGIQSVLKDSNLGTYYICVDESNTLLGMLLTIKEWSDWRCKHVLWIHSVYIDKQFRNMGIYKKLYLHVKEVVELNDSLAGIRLYVDKTNSNAIEVYQKLDMSDEHYRLFEWLKS